MPTIATSEPVTFDPPSTVTVTDSNNDPTIGSEHPYRLNLSDGTSLDPKVINR